MKHNDPIDAISEAFAQVELKPSEVATITPEGVKTGSFFQNFFASKRQQWNREKLWAASVPIDSVCGEVWGVEGVVEGESASAMLLRLDMGFHVRVEQKIKDSPHLCVNRNSDEWPSDFTRNLQGLILDYLNEHPIRKQALKCAFMEYVSPPIVMSREEFERTYIGTFIRDGSKCKCGTSWDAMLYGAECGRCGEKRPISPVAAIKVTTQKDN